MKQKTHSEKYKKQRKFLLVLPLLVIPFLVILFIALGGGKGTQAAMTDQKSGFNINLPDAHFKKGKDKDKLTLYELANKDSARLKELIRNDPYYQKDTVNELKNIFEKNHSTYNDPNGIVNRLNTKNAEDENEAKVLQRMEQIKKAINAKDPYDPPYQRQMKSPLPNPDIEKLERISRAMKSGGGDQADPDITQLNSALDKILAIQHPENAKDSPFLPKRERPVVFAVSGETGKENISVLGEKDFKIQTANRKSFYGPDDENAAGQKKENAFPAMIPEKQTLTSGSVIKIQLATAINIHGVVIPAGHLVYGVASLNGERLKVEITTISEKQNILPVSLEVYDMDGLAGIYIPGNISREVSKQSAELGVNGLGITTLDQSIGAQAASAGIQAARNLIGKKIKMVRVTVRAGYQILLRNNSQK